MSAHMKGVQHLKVPLEDIKLATSDFSDKNLIGWGGFGNVYMGKLTVSGQEINVAVKRLDRTKGQGNQEFLVEIQMLSYCKHENLVSLVGFCDESNENILIYEHVQQGSLDRYLSSTNLLWLQRLKISLDAARGINYLHNDVGSQHRVLHCDIKSSNILLNENWKAKITDLGLSKIGPSNVEHTFLVTNACGTVGYVDPQYVNTGILTKESDVYSFGVVLFEILCGRPAFINNLEPECRFLSSFAKRTCEQNRLDDIIFPSIKDQINKDSLKMFSTVACKCLEGNSNERPTMEWVIEKLEKALHFQVNSKVAEVLKVSLEDIKLATSNFGDKNLIARSEFMNVYIGKLTVSGQEITVAVKRLNHTKGQGNREFLMEIQMLSWHKHENIVSLLGFCDESNENILIYEHVQHGSLDRYLSSTNLLWLQRLKISLGAARGINYLHNDVGSQHRVLHRDIKSSNILLNENWEAKISDFGLLKIGPVEHTFLVTNACGTIGYVDPQYVNTGILTKESDVYSFGVVLFEILCGRLAFINNLEAERRFLSPFAKHACEQYRLYDIIFPSIKDQIKIDSLNMFSMVAYKCLKGNRSERPTMGWIVEKLEKALQLQVNNKIALGIWGKQNRAPESIWFFELDQGHKLQKITINHGDIIYSLTFTTEYRGVLYTSNMFGGLTSGEAISQVILDFDEEIVDINGTVGSQGGDTLISSLCFVTNKRTHGPFGAVSDSVFTVPFDQGSLAGFYGIGGNHIDGIGIYVKAYEEITRVGTWGTSSPGGPQNIWSFKLKRNHHLNKITIDHGDLIYSLMFTTIYRGLTNTSRKFGGWNGGDIVSEVTFDWDEEIKAVNGTVAKSRGDYAGYTIISSISFVTNKKTHGPFGNVRGIPFTLAWDNGSFVGFYGLCGYFIDSIGVYLKAKMHDLINGKIE